MMPIYHWLENLAARFQSSVAPYKIIPYNLRIEQKSDKFLVIFQALTCSCVAIHAVTFNTEVEIGMLVTGTFVGYLIVFAGAAAGNSLNNLAHFDILTLSSVRGFRSLGSTNDTFFNKKALHTYIRMYIKYNDACIFKRGRQNSCEKWLRNRNKAFTRIQP